MFEPLTEAKKPTEINHTDSAVDELELHLKRKSRKSGQTIEANCRQTTDGFVVLKGSSIEPNDSGSIPPGVKTSRQNANIDEHGILQEDVLFRSPSYAAAFVITIHSKAR